jgi:hypothetical protein
MKHPIRCPACQNNMIYSPILNSENNYIYWCQFCGTLKNTKEGDYIITETGKYWKKILEDCDIFDDDKT